MSDWAPKLKDGMPLPKRTRLLWSRVCLAFAILFAVWLIWGVTDGFGSMAVDSSSGHLLSTGMGSTILFDPLIVIFMAVELILRFSTVNITAAVVLIGVMWLTWLTSWT